MSSEEPELKLDSKVLARMIFINPLSEDELRIQCNYCPSSSGSIFVDGNYGEQYDVDWVALATQHIIDKHSDRMYSL